MSDSVTTYDPRELYLDLLKKSVLNLIYPDLDSRIRYLQLCVQGRLRYDPGRLHDAFTTLPGLTSELEQSHREGLPPHHDLTKLGFPHSMVGWARLDSLQRLAATLLRDEIPGDFIECGVWRGGCGVFLRGILAAHGVRDRTVWLADSYQGLPAPSHPEDAKFPDFSKENYPMLAITASMVRRTFETYGLWDEQVRLIEGWFKDTLPSAPVEQLALLRVDGDMHESTIDVLSALYDKVSPGGYVVIDDYGLPACRVAVDEFRRAAGIDDPIETVDITGVFWRKPR